jgi:hypothetical protein
LKTLLMPSSRMSGMFAFTPSSTGLVRFHHDMAVRVARGFSDDKKM